MKCSDEIDAGPVYLKKPFYLTGKAQHIYQRAQSLIGRMIVEIIKKRIKPRPQKGQVTLFKRRSPKDGDIGPLKNIQKVFDYIRMLDAPGYPYAFMETSNMRFEFNNAKIQKEKIIAHVTITKKIKKLFLWFPLIRMMKYLVVAGQWQNMPV